MPEFQLFCKQTVLGSLALGAIAFVLALICGYPLSECAPAALIVMAYAVAAMMIIATAITITTGWAVRPMPRRR